jgi:hypothetical protein
LTPGHGSEEKCVVSVCISSVCMTQYIVNAEHIDGGHRNYDKTLDDANVTATVISLKILSVSVNFLQTAEDIKCTLWAPATTITGIHFLSYMNDYSIKLTAIYAQL